MRVGFIGLGLMGSQMATRLIECGYAVTGHDVDSAKVADAAKGGVTPAGSGAEVARASDVVCLCVTSTAAVEAAVFGADGIAAGGSADKVLVDHSTTIVEKTRQMAGRLAEVCAMGWVDAPVSGGPTAARAGTLAIMAGGDDAAVAQVGPVLGALGKMTHLGPVGAGQVVKMVNQVLVLTNYCVLAEGLKLAENAGADPTKIPECLAGGHAGSNLLAQVFPKMIRREFEPPAGFARQVLKDLDMLHDLARDTGTPTPMSDQARSLFRLLVSRGYGEIDGTAILKLYDDEPM